MVVESGVIMAYLSNTDSVIDSDSDSKPNGSIVLYKNCSHCTDFDLDSDLDLNSYCTHFCRGCPYTYRDPNPCPTMYITH